MITEILTEKGYYLVDQKENGTALIANMITNEYRVLKKVSEDANVESLKEILFLRHPQFPRLYEVFEINNEVYCILEYIKGKAILENINDKNLDLSLYEKIKIITRVCEAINFLHTQFNNPFLHLEINKDSIVFDSNGTLKFKDFGKMVIWDNLKYKNEIIDQLDQLPNELIQKNINFKCFSVKNDILMIGNLIKEITTTKQECFSYSVFENENQSEIREIIENISNRALNSDAEGAYTSVLSIKTDLEKVIVKLSKSQSDYKVSENLNTKKLGINSGKILCVWDDGVFASEIATVIASHNKSVLLIDANLLSPSVDLHIELKNSISNLENFKNRNTLSELMDEYANNRLTSKTILNCASKSAQNNLSCICGNYRMEDYEFYSTEGLVKIIGESTKAFDYTVVVCSKFIYDEFTCASIISSNMLFIPIIANFFNFREYNRYINFLSARKQFNQVEIAFVGKDYSSQEDYSTGICDELCSGKFKGVISKSEKRRTMQGTDKKYTMAMESKIVKQYTNVLLNSGIKV